jgi:hypothetical protein
VLLLRPLLAASLAEDCTAEGELMYRLGNSGLWME